MTTRYRRARALGLAPEDAKTLARLRTPERIQDFIAALPTNFEPHGDTALSVAGVLKHRHAHCIEAAFVAAAALAIGGEKPLLLDFWGGDGDDDHVLTLFKRGRHWGAISKSNHVWLRWRDPIYRSVRELAMSYFHEYVLRDRKTLRAFSVPYDLARVDPKLWVTNPNDCWEVCEALDRIRHFDVVTPAQIRRLRRRDAFEVKAGKLTEYKAPDAKTALRY